MAPVAGRPFLQFLLTRLRAQGVAEVTLGTGYLAEQIEQHFGDGAAFGLTIRYSCETSPLGTGGAVKLAEPLLTDPALILNGDSYVEWNLVPMLALAAERDADLVMALQAVPDVSRYGNVLMADDHRITQFIEKGAATGKGLINAGVYLMRKEIIRRLPQGEPVSLEKDIFPGLLEGRVYGVICDGPFIDIGIPADLERAQTLLA